MQGPKCILIWRSPLFGSSLLIVLWSCFSLEVTLEKKVEGVVWKALIKGAERREEHLPLKEGMESELSPEELEKARKMLAEITGTENLVSETVLQ